MVKITKKIENEDEIKKQLAELKAELKQQSKKMKTKRVFEVCVIGPWSTYNMLQNLCYNSNNQNIKKRRYKKITYFFLFLNFYKTQPFV